MLMRPIGIRMKKNNVSRSRGDFNDFFWGGLSFSLKKYYSLCNISSCYRFSNYLSQHFNLSISVSRNVNDKRIF
jgi:hypothetical protein